MSQKLQRREIVFDTKTIERFWSRVTKTESCWLWMGGKTSRGYGYFYAGGRQVLAHRFALAAVNRPVPDDLVADHICRVRTCVNPDHLRHTSQYDNSVLNSASPPALNKQKNVCSKGHPLSGDNIYIFSRPDGTRRICRECNRLFLREYHKRNPRGKSAQT